MFDIPLWFSIAYVFLLGSIIGSFLEVFTTRFHTGKSINGRSRCLSCGHTLNWYELFPLLSYVVLRGRCRVCHSKIPARLFWMEVITGCLFVMVGLTTTSLVEVVVGLVLVSLALVITLYDVRHLIIPNQFVVAMGAVALTSVAVNLWPSFSWEVLFEHIASGVLASLFYGSLWFISKGRWIGFGDSKLALPLGTMLTIPQTFSFVVLSFWVGAAISIGFLILQWLSKRGQSYLRFLDIQLTMKSEVPFAPFLLIAFALVYFFHADVLSLFTIAI